MNASSSWPYVNSKEKQDQFVYLIRDHSHAQMAIYYGSLMVTWVVVSLEEEVASNLLS